MDIDYVLLGTVWNVAICFLFPDLSYFLPATKSFLDMAASKKQIDSVKINVIFLFTETLLKLQLTCIIIRHFNLFRVSGGNWKTVEYTIEP